MDSAGVQPLEDTRHMDLKLLVDQAEMLKSSPDAKTIQQELSLNYISNCEKRFTRDFSMTNFEYLVQVSENSFGGGLDTY